MESHTSRRYKLTVAYDGSGFHGWQKQEPPSGEPLRTVQGELENALVQVFRQPRQAIRLVGASRTDTGVHALGQAAQCDAATPIPVERLHLAINARLPGDIEVRSAEVTDPDFDVIGDVESKQYRYRIFNAPQRPLGLRHIVHHGWESMDPSRMQAAAERLVGEHDLAGFAAAGHGRSSTVRTIHACRVEEHPLDPTTRDPSAEGDRCSGRELHVVIAGSGFLYHTVRIIAGTLVEVGRGRFDPTVIDEVFESGDRRLAGPTLPPQGLCLEWVRHKADATRRDAS